MASLPVVEHLQVFDKLAAVLRSRAQAASWTSSTFSVAKKLSAMTLSQQLPDGSCYPRSRTAPGPTGSRRWRINCYDPTGAAAPGAADEAPRPCPARRG